LLSIFPETPPNPEISISEILTVTFAVAGQRITRQEVRFEQDGFYVLQGLAAVRSGPFITTMYDQLGQTYMNEPIQDTILWGVAQRPRVLKTPQVFSPSASLFFDFVDGGTAPAYPHTIQLRLKGYKHLDKARPPKVGHVPVGTDLKGNPVLVKEQFFVFASTASLLANEEKPSPIQITQDADFIVHSMDFNSTGDFEALITDTNSKRQWMKDFMRRNAGFGVAEYPGWLWQPKLVEGNSVISMQVRDVSAAPNVVQLALVGGRRVRQQQY
jgi:hypothetical protein